MSLRERRGNLLLKSMKTIRTESYFALPVTLGNNTETRLGQVWTLGKAALSNLSTKFWEFVNPSVELSIQTRPIETHFQVETRKETEKSEVEPKIPTKRTPEDTLPVFTKKKVVQKVSVDIQTDPYLSTVLPGRISLSRNSENAAKVGDSCGEMDTKGTDDDEEDLVKRRSRPYKKHKIWIHRGPSLGVIPEFAEKNKGNLMGNKKEDEIGIKGNSSVFEKQSEMQIMSLENKTQGLFGWGGESNIAPTELKEIGAENLPVSILPSKIDVEKKPAEKNEVFFGIGTTNQSFLTPKKSEPENSLSLAETPKAPNTISPPPLNQNFSTPKKSEPENPLSLVETPKAQNTIPPLSLSANIKDSPIFLPTKSQILDKEPPLPPIPSTLSPIPNKLPETQSSGSPSLFSSHFTSSSLEKPPTSTALIASPLSSFEPNPTALPTQPITQTSMPEPRTVIQNASSNPFLIKPSANSLQGAFKFGESRPEPAVLSAPVNFGQISQVKPSDDIEMDSFAGSHERPVNNFHGFGNGFAGPQFEQSFRPLSIFPVSAPVIGSGMFGGMNATVSASVFGGVNAPGFGGVSNKASTPGFGSGMFGGAGQGTQSCASQGKSNGFSLGIVGSGKRGRK